MTHINDADLSILGASGIILRRLDRNRSWIIDRHPGLGRKLVGLGARGVLRTDVLVNGSSLVGEKALL